MYGLQNSPAFQKVNEVNKTEKVTFVQFSKKRSNKTCRKIEIHAEVRENLHKICPCKKVVRFENLNALTNFSMITTIRNFVKIYKAIPELLLNVDRRPDKRVEVNMHIFANFIFIQKLYRLTNSYKSHADD